MTRAIAAWDGWSRWNRESESTEVVTPSTNPRSPCRTTATSLRWPGSEPLLEAIETGDSQLLDFEDSSVVVIDLKGDDQLLHEEMRQSTHRHKFFTTAIGKGMFKEVGGHPR